LISDLDYGKQRENKLMFFLFVLKENGNSVNRVFEEYIKDIPTTRFSKNFDDDYVKLHKLLTKEKELNKKKLVGQQY
jgi:hypothetical protein